MRNALLWLKLACGLLLAIGPAPSPAQAQQTAELKGLNDQVVELYRAGKFTQAIPLAERYAEAMKARHGPEHPAYATALNNLAQLLHDTNRLSEAERLMRLALAIHEKSLGLEHTVVATDLNNLAQLLQDTNRLSEAELLMRRALAINMKSFGPEHPDVAAVFNNLALLLRHTNRRSEAEPLMRRALAINEKSFGSEHPLVAASLDNLAQLLQDKNRLNEAEQLMWRALAIRETSFGPEHPDVATSLNNLGQLLKTTNRLREAEPLMRRALAIHEKSLGSEHPDVATNLSNLAQLLHHTNRLGEAEPLYRRALLIRETSFGPEHPDVATSLNDLAQLLQDTNRRSEAEPLMRRALAIHEKSFGPEHSDVTRDLNNLALLLHDTNRLNEAEQLVRRALAIDEKSFGPDHADVARDLTNVALLRAELGDWAEAARLHRRAKPIKTAAGNRVEDADGRLTRVSLTANSLALRGSAQAIYRAGPETPAAREEAFELAQWALQTGAADALLQMSIRFAKGTGPLANLVRERQNLVARHQAETRRLDVATGRADAKAAEEARSAIGAVNTNLAAIDARLTAEFKEYAELANPKPLGLPAAQALLAPSEALVLFLDIPRFGKLPQETLAWVVTKEAVRWRSIPLDTAALSDRVAALRCGLDASSWDDAAGWPRETAIDKQRIAEQKAHRARCKQLLGLEVSPADWPPFDLAKSHELYQALLAPFTDLTNGKHLIIVPSGPLTSLPFHVLVTKLPDSTLTSMARYQQAAWLALQQPVTVLPSVGSLQALRQLPPSQALEPYIGFGNPLLVGASGNNTSAWAKQRCARLATTRVAEARGIARRGVSLRAIDLAELRRQEPLPETADELCAVAAAVGALGQQNDTVWLGERATEHNLKALSREGKLAHYKVLHFATHGLLAGESEAILKAKAEPALILTPPKDDTIGADLEEDDGLFTASEVAQLDLDADWIVLSACNTAAGEKGDAEALSGLARAFFYAKARALLVSHWYVNSDAAVKLTTGAFAELSANPKIGRAEALRRSMAELITKGAPQEAHPANWAPFVLVGEGGGQMKATAAASPDPRGSLQGMKRLDEPWQAKVFKVPSR
jgi:CHAT domain-containing protein